MKKLLRYGELVERGVLLERGGYPNCFISFPSEKHVLITTGILFLSGKYSTLAAINRSILSCCLISTRK